MPSADTPDQPAAAVLDPEAAAVLRVGAELLQQRVGAREPEIAPAVVARLFVEVEGGQHRARGAVEQLVRGVAAFAAMRSNSRSSFSGVGSSFHETSSTPTSPCIRPADSPASGCDRYRRVAQLRRRRALAGRVPRESLRPRSRTSSRAPLLARLVEQAARPPAPGCGVRGNPIGDLFTRAGSQGVAVRGSCMVASKRCITGSVRREARPLIGRAPPSARACARGASASARDPSPEASPAPAGRFPPSYRRSGRAARRPQSRATRQRSRTVAPRRAARRDLLDRAAFPHGVVTCLHTRQRSGKGVPGV